MPNIKFSVNVTRPIADMSKRRGSDLLKYFAELAEGIASGKIDHAASVLTVDNTTTYGSSYYQFASALLGFGVGGTSSGSVGATIAGTAVTVTYATSATVSMTAWVAAVNAHATVSKYGTASNKVMKLTTASAIAGNQFKLGNTMFTGVAGTPANAGEFSIDTGDTETAVSICDAINKHPATALRYVACNVAGVVYICLSNNRTADPIDFLKSFASTITIDVAVPTASAYGFFISNQPGLGENGTTFVKSGTNVEDYTLGATGALGGGLGGPSGTLSDTAASGVYVKFT